MSDYKSAYKKEVFFEEAFKGIGGIIIIDRNNRVVYMNENYAKSMDINAEENIGKKITELLPDSRLALVTETGKEEIARFYTLKTGQTVIVNRLPIKKDGKIIGAIGLTTFANIEEVSRLNKKIGELSREASYYKAELETLRGAKYSIEQIVSINPTINLLKDLIRRVAQTKSTVLVSGESGTGKELFAHALHKLSPRHHLPFVRLNCAAIPENLLESELFGYEDGAFTGAKKGGNIGKFELANGGTLLLDEIDSLSLGLQSKLLRVIQEKEVQKIGSLQAMEVDTRLVFTTNQDIYQLVKDKKFREDLFYRINVVEIKIPPLRERMEDIPHIIEGLIPKLNKELGLNITGIDSAVLNLFMKYSWPGNIRELENTIERAFNNALTGELKLEHFDFFFSKMNLNDLPSENSFVSLESVKNAAEKRAILQALMLAKGNKKLAAKYLEIDRSVLYDKIKKYDIEI
ncbi:MAG: sigma 54-interacting transcriptional regulator [Clostridia bacterium]|nr:sigma 54-interacting transcriptional regulator [Clostridia bacterium]